MRAASQASIGIPALVMNVRAGLASGAMIERRSIAVEDAGATAGALLSWSLCSTCASPGSGTIPAPGRGA